MPAPADGKAAEVLRKTLQRAREDAAAGATKVGLNPGADDLDAQLQSKVDAGRSLAASKRPVDFASAARQWAQQVRKAPTRGGLASTGAVAALDDRLAAAAQAEAVRPDADMVWARDLQLASRAASVVADAATRAAVAKEAKEKPAAAGFDAASPTDFAAALATLQHEHEATAPKPDEPPKADAPPRPREAGDRAARSWRG